MSFYAFQRISFKRFLNSFAILALGLAAFFPLQRVEAQDAPTPGGVTITVIYTDPMNVRAGPGLYYDIIGQLNPGEVRSALGISPGREWIQISFDGGLGWVYASYVSIAGGGLQIIEPPPTPTPLTTATIDPTFAAAFYVEPTNTRLPTFTPPPPMTVPRFAPENTPESRGVPSGYFVVILGLLGGLGLAFSFASRK